MAATAFPLGGADAIRGPAVAAGNDVLYMGITIRDTGGGSVVRIRAGTATGVILDTIALAAGDSVTTWYGPQGKAAHGGIFEDYVSGGYEGAVFVA